MGNFGWPGFGAPGAGKKLNACILTTTTKRYLSEVKDLRQWP